VIRRAGPGDFEQILRVINEAAQAYEGVIPTDRWHDPYMLPGYLRAEVEAGVDFWLEEDSGVIAGVMGVQEVCDVILIRHAYVTPGRQRSGVGSRLLRHLLETNARPRLVGTWAAATWAISFYEKHGFQQVSSAEKDRLLRAYWHIPARQVETSVVLADEWARQQGVVRTGAGEGPGGCLSE
jgi:N-acetylglutamate synthase-like GNAT family acetyltransferase